MQNKNNQKEISNYDLSLKIDTLYVQIDTKIDNLEKRLDSKIEALSTTVDNLAIITAKAFERSDKRLDRIEIILEKQVELSISTMKDVKEIKDVQMNHEKLLDDIGETLRALSRAVDKDAITIVDHGRRIKVLERAVAI